MNAKSAELLANIHANLPDLEKLLEEMSSHCEYEDPVYRFYHPSWKVYELQAQTSTIVAALRRIAPAGASEFCPFFVEIIVEAFFHAHQTRGDDDPVGGLPGCP